MYIQVDRSLFLRENLQYSAKLKEKKKKERDAGINCKSSLTAAFWEMFLSLGFRIQTLLQNAGAKPLSFLKQKRSHIFTNMRVQETLSSDRTQLWCTTPVLNSPLSG